MDGENELTDGMVCSLDGYSLRGERQERGVMRGSREEEEEGGERERKRGEGRTGKEAEERRVEEE